ncbi:hypothetical protein PV396_34135 [Streptomyces sp. ME02-8801-2C]|uniref:hypothetical protein n=1 Tax=Streptomyces sp. ME02-8801-2C TaxID=3028680 RepID=UPI0029B38D1E|nr:hypothetical protein [Streptomyces sp. ME02-8801-2C]MDX3456933.1 hypothetical protein [Streptomyces sp. ME02-8801-2C]
MKRHAPPVLVAASALLLTTACGGSDGKSTSEDDAKVAGAGARSAVSASPAVSASAPAASDDRPKIELPADITHTFTPAETGDPVKDAVLKDNAELIRALDAAIVAQNPRLPALEFYTEGEGAVAAERWAQAFVDAGWTVTGVVRYFDRQVSVSSQSTASLSYCGDESKGFSKVIKTGEVKKTPPSKDSYVVYGVQVRKNKAGVWELVKITSTRGADRCQP